MAIKWVLVQGTVVADWLIWYPWVCIHKKKHGGIGGQWNPACVSEMASSAHVQLEDMQNLRVCLDATKTEPGHLGMLEPAARPMATVSSAKR